MKKIIVSTMVTLDGVMENPQNWSFDYWNDEIQQYAYDQLFTMDTLIMGRATFEGFAEAWSSRAGADAFADRMNALPKYVASTTLKEPLTWNSTLIKGDLATEVAKIKQQGGQDILMYGCGAVSRELIKHGLVDEIRLLVYPVLVGSGERIYETIAQTKLKLLETKPFKTGVVALHYQPEK
jgi:dihydrofolate reductase